MFARLSAARGLLVGVVVLGAAVGDARAEPPKASVAAAPAARPAASAARPAASAVAVRGAVVVAIDDDSARAARALARAIYRDPELRPRLDDASARALVGEPLAADAPPAARELAEVRRSLSSAGSDVLARRLLAALGVEAGAELVVAVTTVDGRPTARVLRVATAAYAPIELGANIHGPPDAPAPSQPGAPGEPTPPSPEPGPPAAPQVATSFEWPDAPTVLRALLPRGDVGPSGQAGLKPLASHGGAAPAAPAGTKESGPVWSSPWFWGALGGLAAIGVTVFVLSQTGAADSDTVHLQGRIAP